MNIRPIANRSSHANATPMRVRNCASKAVTRPTALSPAAVRWLSMLALLTGAALLPHADVHAQQTSWRGLEVPGYPSATQATSGQDDDDYELRFQSPDNPRAVFDFYKNYFQRQGFTVVEEKDKRHGFKAELVRGQGGPDDRIELDVKRKDGRYEVEIEFDD